MSDGPVFAVFGILLLRVGEAFFPANTDATRTASFSVSNVFNFPAESNVAPLRGATVESVAFPGKGVGLLLLWLLLLLLVSSLVPLLASSGLLLLLANDFCCSANDCAFNVVFTVFVVLLFFDLL